MVVGMGKRDRTEVSGVGYTSRYVVQYRREEGRNRESFSIDPVVLREDWTEK